MREGELMRRKDQIVKMKIEMANEIPDEPSVDNADAVRIVIKLPDGQRLERRFLMTHSLKHIYYFVFCHPDRYFFEYFTNSLSLLKYNSFQP